MSAGPTPLDLILSLVQHANTQYARKVLGEIRRLLGTGASIEPWASAVQLARDLEAIGPDESYYLLDIMTEYVVELEVDRDAVLLDLGEQIDAVERQHGLSEDEAFYTDDAPEEWSALTRQWDRRFRDLRVELLRRIGEPKIANDVVLRPDVNEARSRAGWVRLLEIADDD